MAKGGSKTAAMLTAVAALITAVVGAVALVLANLPKGGDAGADPTGTASPTPTSAARTVEAWVTDVDAVCDEHAQAVLDAAAEVNTFGPIPEVIRPYTAAWNAYLADILALRVPSGEDSEPVQEVRSDIASARAALVRYAQEYEAAWPRIMSGEMSTEEAASRQNPHMHEFQDTSLSALSDLAALGATNCGV